MTTYHPSYDMMMFLRACFISVSTWLECTIVSQAAVYVQLIECYPLGAFQAQITFQ